jgi:hypothetical protein
MRRVHRGCMITWMTQPFPTMMWMSGFPKIEVMLESSMIGLKIRNKNKSLGII